MKNNDISNRSAPKVAIQIDDFILKYKEDSFTDKVKNIMFSKIGNAEINISVINLINYMFRYTDMTVDLVMFRRISKMDYELLQDKLIDIAYSNIVIYESELELRVDLNLGNYLYYVDDSMPRRSRVAHKGCIDLDSFRDIVNYSQGVR